MTKIYDQMRPQAKYAAIIEQRAVDAVDFYNQHSGQFVEITCPACESAGDPVFLKYGYQHKKCPTDMTVFCTPRPNDSLLANYYSYSRATRMWTELLLEADTARKALQYRPRVDRIIQEMKDHRMNSGGYAVDLGAGSGAFSLCLKESGFFKEVLALDYSNDCVNACQKQGLTAKQGSVDELTEQSSDFICMNDLIEHLYDPYSFLLSCNRVLRPGGFISIATPNGEGFDFKILKEKTGNITPPEHLTYFNPHSMDVILRRAGFEVVFIETPGKLDVDIILKEVQKGLPLAEKNEFLAFLLGQGEELQTKFQQFLVDNKLSSHMLALARKPVA